MTKYLKFRFCQHVLDGFGGQQGRNRIALVHLVVLVDYWGLEEIATSIREYVCLMMFNDVLKCLVMFNDV